jgi:hypothetical protein
MPTKLALLALQLGFVAGTILVRSAIALTPLSLFHSREIGR